MRLIYIPSVGEEIKMVRNAKRMTACVLAASIAFAGMGISVQASGTLLPRGGVDLLLSQGNSLDGITAGANGNGAVLPSGGVDLLLSQGSSLGDIATETATLPIESIIEWIQSEELTPVSAEKPTEEELFRNLVIAQVNTCVNVRSFPSEEGEVLGKLYNNSVGTFISEENGWYQITSGTVTGYVKGEYCVTGENAVEIAKKVGTRFATVTTQTLFVRKEPTTESSVLGMLPEGDDLLVLDEAEGWYKVDVEEGTGWISADYVSVHTEFVQAESKEEEARRLAKEEEERRRAREAAAAKAAAKGSSGQKGSSSSSSGSSSGGGASYSVGSGSEMGVAVAEYALQFVGNPYVYGGTSLTKGADCSGFVMSVYANFGVSLPHSSKADRSQGSAVASLDEAQPGDLICYSGHVALYIGNGQIVHASNPTKGICVSGASYRKILAIRRIF